MAKAKTYPDLLVTIAGNIKKIRKQKGLTQEDMAELGFNYRFYQKLESGTYSPNLATLFKVATALNVSILRLFES